jgi:putative MATE family efflux protein
MAKQQVVCLPLFLFLVVVNLGGRAHRCNALRRGVGLHRRQVVVVVTPQRQRWRLLRRGRGGGPVITASARDNNVNANRSGNSDSSWRTVPGWALPFSVHDKEIVKLAGPALLSLLIDPVLTLIDTGYVGRLGGVPLAALGPCTSIFHAAFNTFRALTASTTALVSRALARGEVQEAGEVVQNTLAIAAVLGVGVMGFLLHQRAHLLTLMGAGVGSALFVDARAYLTVRAFGAPAVLSLMTLEGVFRGHSDTRIPALTAGTAALINLILDPILIFSLGMGVKGAAAATVCAQYVALGCYWFRLIRRAKDGRIYVPFLSDDCSVGFEKAPSKSLARALPLLRIIIGANAAMLIRTLSLMLCWATATAVTARMGTAQVAAHQVGLSLWLLFALVAEAPSVAAQVLGSRYLGVKQPKIARAMAARAFAITLASSAALGSGLYSLRQFLPSVFTSDVMVIQNLSQLIPLLALMQPLVSGVLLLEGLLVGAGAFSWLASTTSFTTAGVTAYLLWMARNATSHGILGVWAAITTMLAGRFAAAAFRMMDRRNGPYWCDNKSISAPTSSPLPPPRN